MANFNRGKYTFSAGPYVRGPGHMMSNNLRHQVSNQRYMRMQSPGLLSWRPNCFSQMQQSPDCSSQMLQSSDYSSQMPQSSVSNSELSQLKNENQMLKERLENLEAMIHVQPTKASAGNRHQPEMEEVAFRKAVLFEEIRKPHYKSNAFPYARPNTNFQTNGRDPRNFRFNQQQNRGGGNNTTSYKAFDITDDREEAPSWTVMRTTYLPSNDIVPETLPWNRKRSQSERPSQTNRSQWETQNTSEAPMTSSLPPWQARRAASIETETKKLRERRPSRSPSRSALEVEEIIIDDDDDCELDIEREENVQFSNYNDLGFEEDENGRVIAYIQARSLPNYYGKMTAGLGIFFSPLHPCNISVSGEMASNEVNAQLEASIKAIQTVWNYNITKIAICTDSEYLFGRLLLPKNDDNATSEERKIRKRLQEAISLMTLVSFVPLTLKRNETYLREAQYLANMAAGLAPTPPPSLSQLHLCTDEQFNVGDVVTIRSEQATSGNNFKGLYEIAELTDEPVLYYVASLLRPEMEPPSEIVAKDELHLVKKKSP